MNKKMMVRNFIFIDLEWDQRSKKPSKKDTILEIGAARMNADSSFIRYIKNKDISWRTRRILGINQKYIKEGADIAQAVSSLMEYSEGTSTVIVWSSDTDDKLRILANKYQYALLHKNVIVLQKLIQELSGAKGNISFERALAAFGVNYEDRHMHNASFDAVYLKNLFVKVIDKYAEINPILKDGVIVRKDSEIFHLRDCTYLKSTKEDEMVNVIEAFLRKPCKRCGKRISPLTVNLECNEVIKRNKKICSYKNKPVTNEAMYEIANYFGLNITGGMGEATLSTGYSFWKIYCNKEGYVDRVKHENYHSTENRGKNFHRHETFPKDVFSLFEYIRWHDETVGIKPIADSLEKIQKKNEKKKKMQKERRRIARMCKLEEE